MASGGMDWAYRVIGAHKLDALGAAIVLHLGWRDAPNFRTDRGIAAALGFDRTSVRRATAKLVALGVIVRRSGQWVASETVAIVEEAPGARRPSASASDSGAGASSPRGPQASGGGGLKPPQKGASSPPMRKEKIEKGAREKAGRPAARSASPRSDATRAATGREGEGAQAASLTAFQRSRVLSGQSVLVDGVPVLPGSPAFEAMAQALRGQGAEKMGASYGA